MLRNHPWPMFASALLIGLSVGYLLSFLPTLLVIFVILSVTTGVLVWCARELRWARRMLRELREHDAEPPS